MEKIGILTGSTRPDRISLKVAEWIFGCGEKKAGAIFEIIDLKKQKLPFIGDGDENIFKQWRRLIEGYDAFIIITPEYNHGIPAVLKNAFDAAYMEWKNKPAAIVSYGFAGGARAAEQVRTLCGALGLFDTQEHTLLFLGRDINENGDIAVSERRRQKVMHILEELIDLSMALKPVRNKKTS